MNPLRASAATRRDIAPGIRCARLPELDGVAPMDAAERLCGLPGLAVLESARPGRNARWTYVTADPVAVLEAPADGPDPFETARRVLGRLAGDPVTDPAAPPFTGGLVGYLSYDLGRRFERMPERAAADQELPLLRLALHDWVLAWDRRAGHAWLAGRALDERIRALDERLEEVRTRLVGRSGGGSQPGSGAGPRSAPGAGLRSGPDVGSNSGPDAGPGSGPDAGYGSGLAARPGSAPTAAGHRQEPAPSFNFRSGLDREGFEAGVEAIRAEIAHGDLYQANLTRRLETPFRGDPWPLYRRLRTGDPALFAAFLDLGPSPVTGAPRAIVSASPEPFLALTREGRVSTDPIKGTRPRGRDRDEDRALACELLASGKDRAENVMIVDVLRNDLGRVCLPGTVRVPRLCRLERTAAVQHLVSTVTGRLAPGMDAFRLLASSFPGGSITGAPKIRAMQLLEGHEPVRRGPYTGAAGWIGADGAMQTSILIRTFVADGARLTLHVGGGITWQSDPAAEWDETVAKARGPLSAIGGREVAAG